MRRTLALTILIPAISGSLACYDPHAQSSKIVREVEAAGSGDISTFTPQGLAFWFQQHPKMALQISAECAPILKTAQANWVTSAEGSVCQAALSNQPPPTVTYDKRSW